MKTILPKFNAQRMMMDYVRGFYHPASQQFKRMKEGGFAGAANLSMWKQTIRQHWPEVSMRMTSQPSCKLTTGEHLKIEIAISLGALKPEDIKMDCLLGKESKAGDFELTCCYALSFDGVNEEQEALFSLDTEIEADGLQSFMIRAFPYNELLSHRFEMGSMIWL